jgi:hypothetical protein
MVIMFHRLPDGYLSHDCETLEIFVTQILPNG